MNGGVGFSSNAATSLRNNRNLRRNRNKFKNEKNSFQTRKDYIKSDKKDKLKFKQPNKDGIGLVKRRLKKENKRNFLILLVVFAALFAFFAYLITLI